MTKKVCISFDYENDKNYYYLLEAWNSNIYIDFNITNCTPSEIQTESVSKVKQVLSTKIGEANYMIAIIGNKSCQKHKDTNEIGFNNWQAYEISKNKEKNNKLIIINLDSNNEVPKEAYGQNAIWIYGFNKQKILEALR